MAVAEALVEQGVRWQQIRTVSCGDNEQTAKRQYERDADRVNQRVEVVVTGEQAPDEGQPGTGPGASAGAANGASAHEEH